MSGLQQQLKQIADARRNELSPYVFEHTQGLVQQGPFKGMLILPLSSWGPGDNVSKLLGVYEDELHNVMHDVIDSEPDHIINVGCAEGYYTVGFARVLPNSTGVAIDMDVSAVDVCNQNLKANNIGNAQVYHKEGDHIWLQSQCDNAKNPFLLMDCEGAELDLLDLTDVPALSKSQILVECHDCFMPGITQTLQERFKDTHIVTLIQQKYKDPYQFEFLRSLSDCDKWALVQEGRASAQTWLYMVPLK
jgi:predicted O-methyltransferase YrrM